MYLSVYPVDMHVYADGYVLISVARHVCLINILWVGARAVFANRQNITIITITIIVVIFTVIKFICLIIIVIICKFTGISFMSYVIIYVAFIRIIMSL